MLEDFSQEKLQVQLASVLAGLQSWKKEVRSKALQKFSGLLLEANKHPSVELPESILGKMVAVLGLCVLEPDTSCDCEAAETLCNLLPVMRHKEAMLKETTWGWEAILRAGWILNPTEGPSPELLLHNSYALPMVFDAYLPPEQLLEAVCYLARDLAVKGISLKIHALLHQFLDEFSGKAVQVKLLLEAFLQNAKGPSMEQWKMALFAFSVLAKQCPESMVGYLL